MVNRHSPEVKERMYALKKEGKKNSEIAKILKLPPTLVGYYLTPGLKERHIQRVRRRWKELSPEEKKRRQRMRRKYNTQWLRTKYQTDPEFREAQRKRAREWYRENRAKKNG